MPAGLSFTCVFFTMTVFDAVCQGIDLDSYASEPANLPLRAAATRILNDSFTFANMKEINQGLPVNHVLAGMAWDGLKVGVAWPVLLLSVLLLILICSCTLHLSACSKKQLQFRGKASFATGCVLAIFSGLSGQSSLGDASAVVASGVDAGTCSAGVAMDGLLNGYQAHEAHGFPGLHALTNIAAETLLNTSGLVKDLHPEVESLLAGEVQSLYNSFVDDRDLWEKLDALSVTNPYNRSDVFTLAELGIDDKAKEEINASLNRIVNQTTPMLKNRISLLSSRLVNLSDTLSDSNATEALSKLLGNWSELMIKDKTVVDATLSKYSTRIKYISVFILVSAWLLIGFYLCCCFKLGGSCGKCVAGLCMECCLCCSMTALILLAIVVFAGAVLGMPCGLLGRPTFVDVTVPTIFNVWSHSLQDVDYEMAPALGRVVASVTGTCFAGRNNGELASAVLGPHHNWTSLFNCVTHLPYKSLEHREDGAPWMYSVFNKTISCLSQAAFVPRLLPVSEVSPATFGAWWEAHNLSAPETLAASLHKAVGNNINVSAWAVKFAKKGITQHITSTCKDVRQKFPRLSLESCESKFDETKEQLIANVSIIFADLDSLETFEEVLLKIARELPVKMETFTAKLGAIFSLIDEKLVSRVNCGLVAKTWTNVVDGSLCSSRGLAGVITPLMKAAFAILLSFFAAALCCHAGCIYGKDSALSREKVFYSTVAIDHDTLLQT